MKVFRVLVAFGGVLAIGVSGAARENKGMGSVAPDLQDMSGEERDKVTNELGSVWKQ